VIHAAGYVALGLVSLVLIGLVVMAVRRARAKSSPSA